MNSADAACVGKVRFETFTQANAVAKRPTRRNSLKPSVYHCQFCHGFHIGNGKRVKGKS